MILTNKFSYVLKYIRIVPSDNSNTESNEKIHVQVKNEITGKQIQESPKIKVRRKELIVQKTLLCSFTLYACYDRVSWKGSVFPEKFKRAILCSHQKTELSSKD